ncbi:MAG TPA: glycosyltransferase [Nitrospirae bacterium]|nr:glycosyltransferase [Nitrospirota bacterium]HDZ62751.1 glycosyltransferase [Nitrospirota bacterium]
MSNLPKVSIIIACRSIDRDTSKCIEECLSLDYTDIEVLVLPDRIESFDKERVIIIPTGPVKPSIKRNLGMKKADGDIFAFIDSDAYPRKDWLKKAVHYCITSRDVGAVTGPNITPPEDNFWQKVGGDILNSYVGLGKFSRRYQITKGDFETTDIMSCNFIFPRNTAEKLNGFDETLLTGEDYKLGLEIMALGKKMIYSPEVCVYHHRRPVFLPHLKQMWNYGRDKGILMRKFFSIDKLVYFLPTAFIAWILGGLPIAFLENSAIRTLYIISLSGYMTAVLVSSLSIDDKKRSAYVFCGICLTHIVYGIAFVKGLIVPKSAGHQSLNKNNDHGA